LLLIAIGAYFQTWVDLWPYWDDKNATYTHGTLVAVVSVWLVWRARLTVNQIEAIPSARALPVIIILSVAWVLAEKANVFILYVTLWPLLVFSALWAGLGLRVANQFAFPLSFLYFAIPVWDYLKPPLQAITSVMVGMFTHMFGLPAALDGSYIILPTDTLFIADDCSGAHFLCIALAVGMLAGAIRRDTLRIRILILVFAGLLSMAFNWLRILLIVLAYLHPALKGAIETMEGHLTLGWWVFALDLIVFGLVLHFVPRTPPEAAERRTHNQRIPIRSSSSAGLWMSIPALVVIPAIAWTLPRFDTYPTEMPDPALGLSTAESDLVSPDLYWSPTYTGTAWAQRFAIQADRQNAIEVYGNQYHEQTQGNELISRGSQLFDPLLFSPISSSIVHLQDSKGQSISARRDMLTDQSGRSWLTVYAHMVDGEPIIGIRSVQLKTALRSMYSRTTAGVVAAATPCVETCDSGVSEVEETFIRVLEFYRDELSQ
jgi:exosortase